MTKHPVEAEELQAYLDKELEPKRQAEVGRHVRECQECSAMIADLQKVSATLRRWEVEPAPPNLKPPVLPIGKPQASFPWMRLALTLSGATAVVLLIAAISIPNLLRSRITVNPAQRPVITPSHRADGPATGEPAQGGGGAFDEVNSQVGVYTKIAPLAANRMISYQVSLTVEVKEFEQAKHRLREIMDAEGGYTAQANFVETPNQPRRANLVLRVPAARLSTILNRIRELGRVKEEHLNSEEVTEQVVDLEARLHNARSTEQRLIDVLNNRTGKVRDILEVEQEIARTREQIERMEAQRQGLMKRVEMATINLVLAEEFKAQLEPTPVGTATQLWNALVDGYESFVGTILGCVFLCARYGLSLAFWGFVIWLTWRLVKGRLMRLAGRLE